MASDPRRLALLALAAGALGLVAGAARRRADTGAGPMPDAAPMNAAELADLSRLLRERRDPRLRHARFVRDLMDRQSGRREAPARFTATGRQVAAIERLAAESAHLN